MPTAAILLWGWMRQKTLRRGVVCAILVFTVFMVAARLVSGVHWLTDIVGGILLSGGLVAGYAALR
jgi:undecaprenyl-diphosphatase